MSIRIGGVPEHFNYPWHFAMESDRFKNQGLDLVWKDFPGGTGAMSTALKNGELDMAVLLTEGAVKEVSQDAPFKIVNVYVESSLVWGIYTGIDNRRTNLSRLKEMKYAISRIGSGSHLMAFVHANEIGQTISQEQMVIINDLKGAVDSLKKLETDLFMWEKFMTKPYVDKGELRKVGEFPTPWPCFVLVATDAFLLTHAQEVEKVSSIIKQSIVELLENKLNLVSTISERYKLEEEDVKQWLSLTHWSTKASVSGKMLNKVQRYLNLLGLTKEERSLHEIVYKETILN